MLRACAVTLAVFALATAAVPASVADRGPAVPLTADSFDRPDSCDVGNGWGESEATPCTLRVEGGRLLHEDTLAPAACTWPAAISTRCAILHRPLSQAFLEAPNGECLGGALRLSARVGAGASSVTSGRIMHALLALDDGTGNGYGVFAARTDSGLANSALHLVDGGSVIESVALDAQLPDEFSFDVLVRANGSVRAEVRTGDTLVAAVDFAARCPEARGDRVAFVMAEFAPRAPFAWMDDVQVSLDPTVVTLEGVRDAVIGAIDGATAGLSLRVADLELRLGERVEETEARLLASVAGAAAGSTTAVADAEARLHARVDAIEAALPAPSLVVQVLPTFAALAPQAAEVAVLVTRDGAPVDAVLTFEVDGAAGTAEVVRVAPGLYRATLSLPPDIGGVRLATVHAATDDARGTALAVLPSLASPRAFLTIPQP